MNKNHQVSPSSSIIPYKKTTPQNTKPLETLSQNTPSPSAVSAVSIEMKAATDEPTSSTPLLRTEASITLSPLSIDNTTAIVQLKSFEFNTWELVTAIAWSPWGKYFAISAGNSIHIYDVDKWEREISFPLHTFSKSLAYSPDGHWLAVGSNDGKVRIWELQENSYFDGSNPLPAMEIDAHNNGVNIVRFNQESSWLASGGNDAIVRIWNIPTTEILEEFVGGTFAVPSIALSSDGVTIAIVNGNYIRLRDTRSRSISGTFLSNGSLYSVAMNTRGNILAAGDIENLIRLWDLEDAFRTGQEHYPTALELSGHTGESGSYQALIWQLTFSTDGDLLASAGGDGTILLWNATNGDLLNTLTGHFAGTTSVSFNPQNTMLASGGLDATVRIWGLER